MTMNTLGLLLVEDNVGDVVLFKQAVQRAGADCRLHVEQDGVSAMEYLDACRSGGQEPRPDLIVLDLNLPRKSGAEVIRQIQDDPDLRFVPLVVLTSSQHEQEVLAGWDPKRCLYLVKPATFLALVDLVRQIMDFVEGLARPPAAGRQ